jgi:hypothetical protein
VKWMRSTWYHHPWLSRQCCAPSSQSIMPFPIHAAAGSMRCAAPRVSVGGSRPARALLVQCAAPNQGAKRAGLKRQAELKRKQKNARLTAEGAMVIVIETPEDNRLEDLERIFDWKVRQGPGPGCVGVEQLCRLSMVLGVS